jgi:F-type H+-transporting ATPase subunit delta
MERDQLHSPLAVTYADALLELTSEPGEAETVGQELADLRGLLLDNPLAQAVLVDPAIGDTERSAMLDRVFSGRVSGLMLKFLHILGEKGRLNLLIAIAGAYHDLLDKRACKIEVDVTVARRLDQQAFETVRQRIGGALKMDVVLHQYVDEHILGGMILRVQDKLIDGSVRTQLGALREKILARGHGG